MKTIISLSNCITIDTTALPDEIRQDITNDLTLENPAYLQAKKYGYYTGKLDPEISIYQLNGNILTLPRGYTYDLPKMLKKHGWDYEIDDRRLLLPPVDFHSKIKLRPYQVPAARAMYKYGNGGLVAPCGSGKTEIMLAVMAALRQPALWVTHTRELLEQVIDRTCQSFEGMTREEIGVIAEGKAGIGDRLTVALVQTLSKVDLNEIAGKFGAVFVDEAQHLGADSFYSSVSQFPARYRLWCSATPEREDGLTRMILAAGGPMLYTIKDEDLPTLTPDLVIVETEYTGFIDPDNYSKMLGELVKNEARNRLVVDTITTEAHGHYILILSDRIEHLTTLKAMLKKRLPDMAIEILTGQLPKKQRIDIMERSKARQIDVLLATQLAREGLDLPHLDRLFLVTPKKAGGATEQEVGRIKRPCDGKQDAVVYDFWDTGNPVFKAQFWKRRAVYQKLGINVDFKQGMKRLAEVVS
ncbi:MAG: DEAD/DEAH box helicase [Syntrophomonadaceae bacterium]|nr:DEAD/DEAH box helicase [Clostridia bacterium]MDD4562002.1 DEAD/DEAH box helicase [Syntrophomonadaceae bacterium]